MPITVQPLNESWFARPQYKPRLERDGGASSWFLLDPFFRPIGDLETLAAAQPRGALSEATLAAVFRETYANWLLPVSSATSESLRALESPDATVVVAGQQPGFLGGPLLSLYKALGAVALARRLQASHGKPCVPVFWVAAEDHDLDEVRTCRVPGPTGQGGARGETTGDETTGDIAFRVPHKSDRRPLSEYPVDDAVEAVLDQATEHFSQRRFAHLARELVDSYRGRQLASGFASFLLRLLGDTGLLVLDPHVLRPTAAPLFERVVDDAVAVMEAIAKGRDTVAAAGVAPFVAGRLPLFLIRDGKRHYVAPPSRGEHEKSFVVGGTEPISVRELKELAIASPERFSSGALLRPLLQQQLLPSVATVGGPAEIGYHRQLRPLARLLGIPTPTVVLRPQATLVDGKSAALCKTVGCERLAGALEAESLMEPLGSGPLLELESKATATQAILSAALEGLPSSTQTERLQRRIDKLHAEALRLGATIEKLHLERRAGTSRRYHSLWQTLFPGGSLQERRWSSLHFVARHGTDWIEELLSAVEAAPLDLSHRLVLFEP